MATSNAFTAGVKPGGLTNNTEIRLLLCYIIKNVPGLSRTEIQTAIVEEELANYFELASAMDDILTQELAFVTDDTYTITEKGAKVAALLAYDLPTSVREAATAAVIRKQTWNKKAANYHAEISELPDGQFAVACTIEGIGTDAFSLTLAMPDALTAAQIRDQFILRGSEVYALLLNQLTEAET